MHRAKSISLVSAIFININVIIGAGLFINPKALTLFAGPYAALVYVLAAFILVPVILTLAELGRIKPSAGGLYVYPYTFISPFAGFLGGWTYFLGKSASAGILAFTFAKFAHNSFPILHAFSIPSIAVGVIFGLIALNILGLKIGGPIQWFFVGFKAVPIFFVLVTSLLYFCSADFAPSAHSPMALEDVNLAAALPVSIFALVGFEVITSIGHLVTNPKKNLSRAIFISFSVVALIYALFQLGIYLVLGDDLARINQVPLAVFSLKVFARHHALAQLLSALVHASILGASFGMLTSNCWNLFKMGEDRRFPFSTQLTALSKGNVPWVCLLVEGFFSSALLLLSPEQIQLQNIAVFGLVLAYLLCAIAASLMIQKRAGETSLSLAIPILACISCIFILYLAAHRIFNSGLSFAFFYIMLGGIGLSAAYRKRKTFM